MDAAAYMDNQRWSELMEQMKWETDMIREERYDAVIHLETTAIGAEEYYTLQNNECRRETPEEAAALDEKIKQVWKGHPHVEYIDNSTDFPRKIIRVVEAICRILGMHAPTSSGFFKNFRISRKFKEVMPSLCLRFEEFFVQTDFLKNSSADNSQSVRHRKQRDHTSELSLYTHSTRCITNKKVVLEERAITAKEYVALLKQRDTTVAPVRRWRRCFEYQDIYFQLDEFEDDQLLLLSVEVPNEDAQVDLPPWIQKYVLDEDVQHNMYEFAKRLYNTEKKMKEEQSLGRLRPALLNDRKRSLLQDDKEKPEFFSLGTSFPLERSIPTPRSGPDSIGVPGGLSDASSPTPMLHESFIGQGDITPERSPLLGAQ
jgi:CYTH domain-containing protein